MRGQLLNLRMCLDHPDDVSAIVQAIEDFQRVIVAAQNADPLTRLHQTFTEWHDAIVQEAQAEHQPDSLDSDSHP